MTQRDASGRFLKGQSGNPGGRPKMPDHVRKLAQDKTEAAIDTLVELMQDPQSAPSVRVDAANSILDRGWGKPTQYVDQTMHEDENIAATKPNLEEILAIAMGSDTAKA